MIMKKLITPILAVLFLALAACEKDYTCACTYVANASGPNAGQPNKEENTSVKGRAREQADVDCLGLEGKYISQSYSGSCLLR